MASPGNQHCVSCIGTLSFPTAVALLRADRVLGKRIAYKNGVVSVCPSVSPMAQRARQQQSARQQPRGAAASNVAHRRLPNGPIAIAIRARFEYDSSTIRLQHRKTRYNTLRGFFCVLAYEIDSRTPRESVVGVSCMLIDNFYFILI